MPKNSAVDELNDRFAMEGVAQVVSGNGGLPLVRITTPASAAEIYLHGAQLTSWQPAGHAEVIFLSKKSRWEEGRAIRGGIPICFPWFRAKRDDPKAPAHGFVRTKSWGLEAIEREDDAVIVTLATESDESTKKWWPHDFRLVHRIMVSDELSLELIATNTGPAPMRFEEAQHAYYRVGQVQEARVAGLDGVAFLDNADSNREKTQHGDVVLSRQTDNAYLNTESALEIVDPGLRRRIRIRKADSHTTVVWNPWSEGARSLADLGDDEWQQMLCVEASNILDYAVTLGPGEQHSLVTTIRTSDLTVAQV